MRRVTWSETASNEFIEILRFLAEDNPHAAKRAKKRVRDAAARLHYFNSGRIGRVPETFEKLVPKSPYILAYELRRSDRGRDEIFILHIIHAARDWPEGKWPE